MNWAQIVSPTPYHVSLMAPCGIRFGFSWVLIVVYHHDCEGVENLVQPKFWRRGWQ